MTIAPRPALAPFPARTYFPVAPLPTPVPGYITHARWGYLAAVVVAIAAGRGVYALAANPVLAAVAGVGAAVGTFAGAIYPDVDHHESIPRRKAVRGFQVVVFGACAGLAAANWDGLVGLAATLDTGATTAVAAALAFVGTLLAVALVDPAIGAVTGEHRGWTHSVGINLVLVAVAGAGAWLATGSLGPTARLVAVGLVGTVYLGPLVHLELDGELL